MKVAIMTDENSGMLKADAERLGIFIMPMPFFVNGELTYESESFTKKDFYAKLAWKREKNKRKSLFLQNLFLFVGVFLKKDVTLSSECAADAHKELYII